MIAYDLQCVNGHTFEGWFEDGKAYKSQEKKGLISCPACDETSVSRILSTFAIKKSLPMTKETAGDVIDPARISQKVVDFVEKNFDDVGPEFTKEALKIHYGVNEPRNIRGVSTKEEEKTLKKEGIQFIKFPLPSHPDADS